MRIECAGYYDNIPPEQTSNELLICSGNSNFEVMKKLILAIIVMLILASCTQTVCPAYSDTANDMKNNILQKGNVRADGINRIYRDSYQKKLR